MKIIIKMKSVFEFQMAPRAERTPLQLAQSTINLLNLLLFCKIFLIVTSISFISVALFGKEDKSHVNLRDRTFLLQSGLYVGCVSLGAGLLLLLVHFLAPQGVHEFSKLDPIH